MNIIKNFNVDAKKFILPKAFYFKLNLVYYINNSKKIIVGYLKNNIVFIPKYIFEFKNDLEESEIKEIIFTSINDYIIKIKCNPKMYFQNILNEENQQIENLLILNQRKTNSINCVNKNAKANDEIKNIKK